MEKCYHSESSLPLQVKKWVSFWYLFLAHCVTHYSSWLYSSMWMVPKLNPFPKQHNGLKTGIKRTTFFLFASAVKTLIDSIFPCFLQLKHSKWQIFINFIFLSQFHNFISFWWVHVRFQLQWLYNYVLLIEECD